MKLVLVDPEELKSLIQEVVANALKELPPPVPAEQIMKRAEVAKELKVSLVTVSQWVKDGRLPCYRINSRVFFKRSEIMELFTKTRKFHRR